MFRRGRSGDDIQLSSLSLLKTVQNRLSSLCRNIAAKLEERLAVEKDHPSSELIRLMGNCLNVKEILDKGVTDEGFNVVGSSVKVQELAAGIRWDS